MCEALAPAVAPTAAAVSAPGIAAPCLPRRRTSEVTTARTGDFCTTRYVVATTVAADIIVVVSLDLKHPPSSSYETQPSAAIIA